jgi:hypothetical protein
MPPYFFLPAYLVASPHRGYATIQEVFERGLPKAVVGSDRWAAQLKTQAKGHQLCLSHLQRDVVWLEEQEALAWSSALGASFLIVFRILFLEERISPWSVQLPSNSTTMD